MKVLISSDPAELEKAKPQVTIEAEYGDRLVEGSIASFAHHGSRSDNPVPCIDPRALEVATKMKEDGLLETAVFGISHFDLDTLGCLMIFMAVQGDMGLVPIQKAEPFFELAAFVDTNGPHRLKQIAAYWAWSRNNMIYPPRDGTAQSITPQVVEAAKAVQQILLEDKTMLQRGWEFLEAEDALNTDSLRDWENGVALRISDQFTNHLYSHPWDGSVAAGVAALNTAQKSVTVSLADHGTRR
jgi:hypothetical protein